MLEKRRPLPILRSSQSSKISEEALNICPQNIEEFNRIVFTQIKNRYRIFGVKILNSSMVHHNLLPLSSKYNILPKDADKRCSKRRNTYKKFYNTPLKPKSRCVKNLGIAKIELRSIINIGRQILKK